MFSDGGASGVDGCVDQLSVCESNYDKKCVDTASYFFLNVPSSSQPPPRSPPPPYQFWRSTK